MNDIKEDLKEILLKEIETAFLEHRNYKLYQIGSIDLLENALLNTGCFLDVYNMSTNGWEQDWWADIIDENTKEIVANASGSMYFGNISFTFIDNES